VKGQHNNRIKGQVPHL